MNSMIVLALVLLLAVPALVATVVLTLRRNRNAISRERAEREGLLGAEGLRHAAERADENWVRGNRAADTNDVGAVTGHTIADAGRTDPR